MYCGTDVNLQIDRMKNFEIVKLEVITPYISNLWCDQFSENLVFSILNRVVLIQPHITEGRRCDTTEVRKPGFKITEVSVEHRRDSQSTVHTFMFRAP